MTPPDNLKAAFGIINEGRKSIGKPPFKWHDKLHTSAQELAEWLWTTYTSGGNPTKDSHHDFLGRLKRAGWVNQEPDGSLKPHPPDSRPGISNVSECGAIGQGQASGKWQRDPAGYSYPPQTPEDAAKATVKMLTHDLKDQKEGHVWDFRTNWTHAAIGHKEGMLIVGYGWLPGEVEPEDPLIKNDFDVI